MNILESLNTGLEKYIIEEKKNDSFNGPRYKVVKYNRFYYSIVDSTLNNGKGSYLRKGPNPDYSKPIDKENNKIILFKNKKEAEDYIKNI